MGRLALFAALLALALLSPATALAADATIIVGANGQKTLVPANVTVDPGNTVTWQWGANSQNHHIVSDATTGLDTWNSGERTTGSFVRAFPRSGSFRYHCAVHPDVMRGTVAVTGAPVAALSAPTPSPAFVGEAVTFDASASTDDGAIVEYRWDFDGGGVDETTTLPTTSHVYATAGSFTAKVTVVDDRPGGSTADATRSVTVFSRSPTAAFTASPATVAKGASVTLDAATSIDHDGTIAEYAWDLGDGAGFVVGTATKSATFATTGAKTVTLRVTDDDGLTGVTTRTVTVTNQAPTAALSASKTGALVGEQVTFNATGSADPDGTIASYQWDLDGNGSFETPGGTTPTIAKSFTAAGPVTVRVRVTDNDGATADATVPVDIAAPATSSVAPAPPSPAPIAPLSAPAPIAPRSGPSPSVPARSSSPPAAMSATAPRGQRLKRQRGVRVRVACAAACRLTVSGTVTVRATKLKLVAVQRSLAPAGAATITLKVARRDLRTLRAARGRVKASVTVRSASGVQRLAISLTA
jgi:plastocyanin/chitodextrinase